jgi:hypothetical protein
VVTRSTGPAAPGSTASEALAATRRSPFTVFEREIPLT